MDLVLSISNIKINLKKAGIKEVGDYVFNLLESKKIDIANIFGRAFVEAIRETEEWKSLGGEDNRGIEYSLLAEFGLDPARAGAMLSVILDTWEKSFTIKLVNKSTKDKIDISMIIEGVRSDYSDVLALPEASIESVGKNGVTTIPWLRYILLEADSITLPNWVIVRKPTSSTSRSGFAFMGRSRAGNWKLKSPFNLPEPENFVNRIIGDQGFENRINSELTGLFK